MSREELRGEKKVLGGKLLRVTMGVSDGTISYIKVTGDFFLHPEESIKDLESGLIGEKMEKESLQKKMSQILKDSVTVGFSPTDLTNLIIKTYAERTLKDH